MVDEKIVGKNTELAELAAIKFSDDSTETAGEVLLKKAAAMAATGAAKNKVAKSLGLNQYGINKLWRNERFKRLLAEIGDDAVAASKATTRNELAKLSTLAIKALEVQLKKHNLMAAVTVLRAIGVETDKGDKDEKGGFSLILASSAPITKTIEVKQEKADDTNVDVQD